MKTYELSLPVFKKGDDMAHQLEKHFSVEAALNGQAGFYEDAAKVCRRLAAVAKEHPLEVQADTHTIVVAGAPEYVLDSLVTEDVLVVVDYDEPDEDNMDEDDYDDDDV
jgi:hypothetical protein